MILRKVKMEALKPEAKRQITSEFDKNQNAKGKGVYFQAFSLYGPKKD